MTEAALDTIRLRELAKAALSTADRDNPWDWHEELQPNWLAIEGRMDLYFWQRFDAKVNGYDTTFIAAVSPAVILSLLDRIEELDRQLEADGKNCATYHVDESIYDADLAAANRRIEECEALLRSMEPTIAAAMAATWTPEQIQAYRKALKKP